MAERKKIPPAVPKKRAVGRRGQRQPLVASTRKRRPQRTAAKAPSKKFLIVGIGASAGGLEALEEFFQHMPADSGMAFVVVTHQPPNRASLLPDILRKSTSMRLLVAADNTQVEPNCVYVAPPDGHLSISQAMFHRLDAAVAENVRLPIDTFFRALAADQQEAAVGIVLSGTGTDGTLGLKEIKAVSGMVMVQQPQSAKYDGMPRSALTTGVVDYVLPPAAMPERLLSYAQSSSVRAATPDSAVFLADVLERIFMMLRIHVGHDFSEYKPTTIRRRIARRMNVHHIADPNEYLRFLQEHPHELDLLFKELLISVTSFFRDPEIFDALAIQVLPQLLASKSDQDVVRVWVPGCATGEEAYSLGILFQEGLQRAGKYCKVQIFATDLDPQAIEIARRGVYPEGIAADVSADRLARFFAKEDSTYRIAKEIRDMVIFATHNVLSEPPFTKLDLLSCRNLLIYLDAALQKRLLPAFHYALNAGGFLFLGTSESISGFDHLFTTVDGRGKLFKRKDLIGTAPFLENIASRVGFSTGSEQRPDDRGQQDATTRQEVLIDKLLVAHYAPPSVMVTERGDIIHIHGRTGTYLEPAPGQPRLNVLTMAREGLRLPLTGALRQASAQDNEIILDRIRVKTNGDYILVQVSVQKVVEPEALRGLLRVSFEPVHEAPTSPPQLRRRSRKRATVGGQEVELEGELAVVKAELQRTREELNASYEEFQSANEEMQSTNEELQSTNEELESAKEELQSLNEELQTVNAELQSKIESLSGINDDMTNLLNSTDIATIFLDNDLHVKRFTSKARDVFHLIQSDVGRPLSDIASALHDANLVQDAQEVLRTLTSKDYEVPAAANAWYLARIQPYRTARNVIDGVVITFVDITRLKQAEAARQEAEVARRHAERIVQAIGEPLLIVDTELRVIWANQQFYQYFQLTPEATVQRYLDDLDERQWDLPELRQWLSAALQQTTGAEAFELQHVFPRLGDRTMRLNAYRIEQQPGEPDLLLVAFKEVTPHPPAGSG